MKRRSENERKAEIVQVVRRLYCSSQQCNELIHKHTVHCFGTEYVRINRYKLFKLICMWNITAKNIKC